MKPLTIVAKLKAKAGSEDKLLAMLQGLVGPTRAEQGCVTYDLHRSHEDAGVFIFYETWDTRPLWEAHMNSPHLVAFSAEQGEVTESWDLFVGEKV